jgi:hypothetical protein
MPYEIVPKLAQFPYMDTIQGVDMVKILSAGAPIRYRTEASYLYIDANPKILSDLAEIKAMLTLLMPQDGSVLNVDGS